MGLLEGKPDNKKDKKSSSSLEPIEYKNLYFLNTPPQVINASSASAVFKSSDDVYSKFTKLKDIQSGTTGMVSKIMNKDTSVIRAVKTIKIKDNKKLLEEAQREVSILKNLDHPNIEKVYEYFETANNVFSIVMELVDGTELFNMLTKVGQFKELDAAIIMYQLFSSIKFLHDNGIIHRDIKPENIIIQDEKNLFIKLIDYGSCEILKEGKLTATQTVGTPSYIAPEILNGEEYDFSCDMWSLGVLMYFILSGSKPFNGTSEEETYKLIKTKEPKFKEKAWDSVSSEAKNLIKSLLVKKKKKRININQALNSDWIKKFINKTVSNNLHNEKYCIEKLIPNIKNFKNLNQIQLMALFYFIHNQIDYNKHEEVIQITKEFMYYDRDNDGKLSEDEFINLLLENGVTKEELNQLCMNVWTLLGDNKGKFVFYEGFIVMCLSNKKSLYNDKSVQKLFLSLNKDKTMKININDLKLIYDGTETMEKKNINPTVWENFYKSMGLTNEQPITYGMFNQYMKAINV